MKKNVIIMTLLIFLVSQNAKSQFQNGGNSIGLDRSIGAADRQNEAAKPEPVDYAKLMTEKLTTKLELDAFQSAVVKNLMENFIKKTAEISLENIPNDAMMEKSRIAREEMERKFREIFTDKQKALFDEFLIENNGKLKKNKKKKKNDTSKSAE